MTKLQTRWYQTRLGIEIGDGDGCFSYLAFADDITVLARSRAALATIIRDLSAELARAGLHLIYDKCNRKAGTQPRTFKVDGYDLQVIEASAGFKVLGVMYCLRNAYEAEFQHRVNCAWAKLHQIWPLLQKRNSSLQKRLLLFGVMV